MRVATSLFALALVASATIVAGARRRVSCEGTSKNIPDGALDLYNVGLNNDTMNFDTMIFESFTAFQANDFAEYLNTKRLAARTINAEYNLTIPEINTIWNSTWYDLGATLDAEGEEYAADGDNISAASAWHRATMAFELAGRFEPDLTSAGPTAVYLRGVTAFVKAINLENVPNSLGCSEVFIPFETSSMHAYWCPAPNGKQSTAPSIVTINGYDGTAEFQYYSIAQAMVPRGYNVLVVEGPGQGYTARINGLKFFPDYERATSTALDYLLSTYGVDASRVALWAESFGGYLGPRSFAFEPRFSALVSNGGVYDFYQSLLCKFPDNLLDLYYADTPETDAKLNYIYDKFIAVKIAGEFAVEYGKMGFPNVTSLTSLFDTLEPYNLIGDMAKFNNRSVFVYDPAWDTLVGNQSQIFWANLPSPAATARIVQLDPYRGTGLHCAVGSTANLPIAIARWLRNIVGL